MTTDQNGDEPDFQLIREHPSAFVIFGFFFPAILTLPGALGLWPLPPSLQRLPIVGILNGWLLILGCVVGIIGVSVRKIDRGVPLEQLGVGLAGIACAVYILAVLALSGPVSGAWVIASAAVIEVFCVWRYVQLQRYIHARRLIRGKAKRQDDA